MVETAADLRALEPGEHVPIGTQDAGSLSAFIGSQMDEALPPDEAMRAQRVLEWFGVVPASPPLRELLSGLLTSQVAGYYDPRSGYLVLVDDAIRDHEIEGLDPELAQRIEDGILLHEIVHYLQDVHFDLEAMTDGDPWGDATTARHALGEGDATLVMYNYVFGLELERLAHARAMLEGMLAAPEAMLEMSPDLPGSDELAAAPPFLRELLLFPYLRGLVFSLELRRHGGLALVDYAFEVDPPQSTEQILHPEKWIESRDAPMLFAPQPVPGATIEHLGSWGELGIGIVLGERSSAAVGADVVAEAAAGWGGDAYVLYAVEGGELLTWATEWDSEGDADEFLAVAGPAFAGWRIERPSATRIVLADTDGAVGGEADAALAAWGAAEARRTESEAPDLEAIGVTAADLPEPMGFAEMMDRADDSGLLDVFSQLSYEELLDAPGVGEAAAELVASMTPEEVREMLADPEFREHAMEQARAALASAPQATIEHGRLLIEELGFEMRVPEGGGWRQVDMPDARATQFQHPGGALLMVSLVPFPPGTPIRLVAVSFETEMEGLGLEKGSEQIGSMDGRATYAAVFLHPGGGRVDMRLFELDRYGVSVVATRATEIEGEPADGLDAALASLPGAPSQR
jgi:hypothetical protein